MEEAAVRCAAVVSDACHTKGGESRGESRWRPYRFSDECAAWDRELYDRVGLRAIRRRAAVCSFSSRRKALRMRGATGSGCRGEGRGGEEG
jgi:hypothetical protein